MKRETAEWLGESKNQALKSATIFNPKLKN